MKADFCCCTRRTILQLQIRFVYAPENVSPFALYNSRLMITKIIKLYFRCNFGCCQSLLDATYENVCCSANINNAAPLAGRSWLLVPIVIVFVALSILGIVLRAYCYAMLFEACCGESKNAAPLKEAQKSKNFNNNQKAQFQPYQQA